MPWGQWRSIEVFWGQDVPNVIQTPSRWLPNKLGPVLVTRCGNCTLFLNSKRPQRWPRKWLLVAIVSVFLSQLGCVWSFTFIHFCSGIKCYAILVVLHAIVLNFQAEEVEAFDRLVASSVLPENYGPVPVPPDGRPSPCYRIHSRKAFLACVWCTDAGPQGS